MYSMPSQTGAVTFVSMSTVMTNACSAASMIVSLRWKMCYGNIKTHSVGELATSDTAAAHSTLALSYVNGVALCRR